MAIYVSGSLAYDRIMTFQGNFRDHILMDKLHMINVSFMVNSMDERRGGCAGNIAHSLALLGEKPIIIASAGRDFETYATSLSDRGLPLAGINIVEEVYTALCYITTDMDSNQITGFYAGAMAYPATYAFPQLNSDIDIAIVSPGNVEDMKRLPEFYRSHGIRYIYDPGQQLPVLSGEDLRKAIEGSFACITNDYELNMICRATGMSEDELLGRTLWLVTTLGAKGVHIRGADGTDITLPAVPVANVADPTGAGDAQRSGLLKGLALGLPLPEAAKFGAVSASYAIEVLGTQEHKYSPQDFQTRFEEVFGPMPGSIR